MLAIYLIGLCDAQCTDATPSRQAHPGGLLLLQVTINFFILTASVTVKINNHVIIILITIIIWFYRKKEIVQRIVVAALLSPTLCFQND